MSSSRSACSASDIRVAADSTMQCSSTVVVGFVFNSCNSSDLVSSNDCERKEAAGRERRDGVRRSKHHGPW